MKTLNGFVCCMVLASSFIAVSRDAEANDRKLMLPISNAMSVNDAKDRLDGTVKFYFGTQNTPTIANKLATDKTSNKTNALANLMKRLCNWVFLFSMLQLQKGQKSLVPMQS